MLHSILGAYTCYRPDVGYVSDAFQFFMMLWSIKKVKTLPSSHIECCCGLLKNMKNLEINGLIQFPWRNWLDMAILWHSSHFN